MIASNPLSTQDDVAAALVKYYNMPVFGYAGESLEVYQNSNWSSYNIQAINL